MGREVRRVPLDFDWPLNEVWDGFLLPGPTTDPPEGEGWQLWETVSEGSPVSPVFATAEQLAEWMSDPARGREWVPAAVAAKFIADGWAPSFVSSPATGMVSGVEWMGTRDDG